VERRGGGGVGGPRLGGGVAVPLEREAAASTWLLEWRGGGGVGVEQRGGGGGGIGVEQRGGGGVGVECRRGGGRENEPGLGFHAPQGAFIPWPI
jgi:hypothetical protein